MLYADAMRSVGVLLAGIVSLTVACAGAPEKEKTDDGRAGSTVGTSGVCACSGVEYCTAESTCAVGHALNITLTIHSSQNAMGTVERTFGMVGGYFYEPVVPTPPPMAQAEVIATAGACKATRSPSPPPVWAPPYRVRAADVGEVTITGSTVFPETMVLHYGGGSGSANYLGADLSLTPAFKTGDALRLANTGGADLPAMTASVVAPTTPLFFSPIPVVTHGEPLDVRWSAGSGVVSFFIATYEGLTPGTSISCTDVPDTGSFTIPDTLTQYLQRGIGGFIRMDRLQTVKVATPTDATQMLTVSATVGSTMTLSPIN
jgi:hypothetical protein